MDDPAERDEPGERSELEEFRYLTTVKEYLIKCEELIKKKEERERKEAEDKEKARREEAKKKKEEDDRRSKEQEAEERIKLNKILDSMGEGLIPEPKGKKKRNKRFLKGESSRSVNDVDDSDATVVGNVNKTVLDSVNDVDDSDATVVGNVNKTDLDSVNDVDVTNNEVNDAANAGAVLVVPDNQVNLNITATFVRVNDFISNGFTESDDWKTKSSFIVCTQHQFDRFHELQTLALNYPQLVTPLFRIGDADNGRYLVVEELENVEEYFDKKLQRFLKVNHLNPLLNWTEEQKVNTTMMWWEFMKDDFVIIFRDLVKAILYLYRQNRHYCYDGNLRRNIFVSRNTPQMIGAKLLPSMTYTIFNSFIDEANDLMMCMNSIVFPDAWAFDMHKHPTCPSDDLRHFFTFLPRLLSHADVYVPFVLDHPLFWNPSDKVYFTLDLITLKKQDYYVRAILTTELNRLFKTRGDWKSYIKDPLLKSVLNKSNRGKRSVKAYTKAGVEIIRFFGAVYAHANDSEYRKHRPGPLTPVEIEAKLVCAYPQAYLWLKDVLAHLAFGSYKYLQPLETLQILGDFSA